MKRRLIDLLLLVLLLPILAVSVSATLAVDGLSTKNSGDATWTLNGNSISGEVNAKKTVLLMWTTWSAQSGTLTLTNSSGAEATLKFGLNIVSNDGSVTVDGTTYTSSTSIVKENWANGSSFSIVINSGENENNKTQITLTGITLSKDESYTTTFTKPENGSYTVGGVGVTETTQKTQSGTQGYAVAAAPADGYKFLCWYDETNQQTLSRDASTTLMVSSDCTISAKFVQKSQAIFQVGGLYFDTLGAACKYAETNSQTLIVLAESGEISEICTIPTGVTLLIPYDDAGTRYTATSLPPYQTTYVKPSVYRTLTMEGAEIVVNGEINVGGQHFAKGQATNSCKTSGPYGHIKMDAKSSITVNDGGVLYAWGYITGNGNITANSGATVWEYFQIMDFRGGTATCKVAGKVTSPGNEKYRVFPLSQYYVQNIEVTLTLNYGATEKVYENIYIDSTGQAYSTTFSLVGTSDAMFLLSEDSSFSKKYDPSKDRSYYDMTGKVSLGRISISIKYGVSVTIASEDYFLPINGNTTLTIEKGAEFTVGQKAALLPGAEVIIDEGGKMTVTSALILYDSDDWSNSYTYKTTAYGIQQVAYSPSWTNGTKPTRIPGDATIDVNGTLTAPATATSTKSSITTPSAGIFTTSAGANITSSKGTGKYVQSGTPGTGSYTTYQYNQNDSEFVEIPITPAKLLNASGSYTETSRATAGDVFTYQNGMWGAAVIVGSSYTGGYANLDRAIADFPTDSTGSTYIRMIANSTEPRATGVSKNVYLDLNGKTVTLNGTMTINGGYSLYGMDSTGDYAVSNNGVSFDSPKGSIDGTIDGSKAVWESSVDADSAYATKRYVAVTSGNTTSFHRFNISVTSFRVLFNPGDGGTGALFFEALFRGDNAAMGAVSSISFTLDGTAEQNSTATPVQNSEVFISDAAWNGTLSADAVKAEHTATATITFENGATTTSSAHSISYLQALKTAYNGGMLSLATNASDEEGAKKIVDDYMNEHSEFGWSSASAISTNAYVLKNAS